MDSLESGTYNIFHVQFIGPDVPVVRRALGVQDGVVVILPEGAEAPKWEVTLNSGPVPLYTLVHGGTGVFPERDRVRAIAGPPPHPWFILRAAPHPPPVGADAYSLLASPEPNSGAWYPPSGNPPPDAAPVELVSIGYPWWFVRVNED